MPDISVAMITYNQESYIRQAVESVLAQKTGYSFEIVIGEDCSTDSTRAILNDYAEKYPGQIKLLKREKNLGPGKNIVDVLRNCSGRYLAFLEGDDYWNSEQKLQIQVEFLEQNGGYSSCYGDVSVIDGKSGAPLDTAMFRQSDVFGFESLCNYWHIAINSFVMRNVFTEYYLAQLARSNFIGDIIILTIAVKHGPIKYIDAILSAYRSQVPGAFTSRPDYLNHMDLVSAHAVIYDLADDGYEKAAAACEMEFHAAWAAFLLDGGEAAYKCPICRQAVPIFRKVYNHHAYEVKKKHNLVSSDMEGLLCPYCGSTALERHLFAYLSRLDFFATVNTMAVLHLSPEKVLNGIFIQLAQSYTGVSFPPPKKAVPRAWKRGLFRLTAALLIL